jgi:hypothetical protein
LNLQPSSPAAHLFNQLINVNARELFQMATVLVERVLDDRLFGPEPPVIPREADLVPGPNAKLVPDFLWDRHLSFACYPIAHWYYFSKRL